MHAQSIQKPQHVNAPVGIASGKFGPAFPFTLHKFTAQIEPSAWEIGDRVALADEPSWHGTVVGILYDAVRRSSLRGKIEVVPGTTPRVIVQWDGDTHPRLWDFGTNRNNAVLSHEDVIALDTVPECPECHGQTVRVDRLTGNVCVNCLWEEK